MRKVSTQAYTSAKLRRSLLGLITKVTAILEALPCQVTVGYFRLHGLLRNSRKKCTTNRQLVLQKSAHDWFCDFESCWRHSGSSQGGSKSAVNMQKRPHSPQRKIFSVICAPTSILGTPLASFVRYVSRNGECLNRMVDSIACSLTRLLILRLSLNSLAITLIRA